MPLEYISLSVDGSTHSIHIRRDAKARRLTLRVRPAKRDILLSVPERSSHAHAEKFIQQNAAWIHEKLSALPEQVQISHGAVIPIRGYDHEVVNVSRGKGVAWIAPSESTSRTEHCLYVAGDPPYVARRAKGFLKSLAHRDLERAVAHYSNALAVKQPRITMRDTTSRWGSCSALGELSFSWRLIFTPAMVLDYLAAHEVTHLRVHNHSAQFWTLLESACGHVVDAERWLKDHGSSLHRYV